MAQSEFVGSNGSPKHPDTSSMNLVGAPYNGLASWVQFPNIQKKRRSEKRKGSNFYRSERNVAKVPAAENVIGITQTFGELLTLRRLRERSSSPTQICDCTSLTRIRNCYTEPNYTAKQQGISDRQTFEDAERPPTCIDALAAEMGASLTKKKRNKKKSAVSSSADFALGNYHLPLGKSSGISTEPLIFVSITLYTCQRTNNLTIQVLHCKYCI